MGAPPLPPSLSRMTMIRDVWAHNLEKEFKELQEVILQYPYVAMDTEFPGVVAKPVGSFRTTHEFYYQTVRYNVNMLKIIQLGITVLNERGEVPDKCCTWQFNFRFSLEDDIYAQDSIDLLRTGGINFDYSKSSGIDMIHFAELLISSGIILNPNVTLLSFHSGYDFAYVLKMVTGRELPEREEDFTAQFHLWFPSVYDIKYILRSTELSHNLGLDPLAEILGVRRIGTAHQAGSDSLLTGHTYFKLIKDRRLEGGVQIPQLRGVLYGLNEDSASNVQPNVQPNGQNTPSPSQVVQQQAPASFPSTPVMSMVMHGGASNPRVHQAHHTN